MMAFIAALCGCSQRPPQYGVVDFAYPKDGFTLAGVPAEAISRWQSEGRQPAILHFRGAEGDWLNIGFALVAPDGEEILPAYFRKSDDKTMRLAYDNKKVNPILSNVLMGDFDIYLVFPIKQTPSTAYVLRYSRSGESYPVSRGALSGQ